jgi:hypothetical protein
MLRAYSRGVVNAINSCKEVATFIPALAYTFARSPAEVWSSTKSAPPANRSIRSTA